MRQVKKTSEQQSGIFRDNRMNIQNNNKSPAVKILAAGQGGFKMNRGKIEMRRIPGVNM
jgi:hypothetical protein